MYIDDITDEDFERWAQEEIDSRPELSLKLLHKLCKDNNCIERGYSKGEFFDVYVYPVIWRDITEEEDAEIWKKFDLLPESDF